MIRTLLEEDPVIMAVKNEKTLHDALESDGKIVFLLYGTLPRLEVIVRRVLGAGKMPFVHVELVDGLRPDAGLADYFAEVFGSECGIITTHTALVTRARALGVPVIQRVFAVDKRSLEQGLESLKETLPDALEVIPGVVPSAIRYFHERFPELAIIAGGLIRTKKSMYDVITSGGVGVSTTDLSFWEVG